MALQKMIRIGNSLGMTFPKDFVDARSLTETQLIELQTNVKTGEFFGKITKPKEHVQDIVDPEVYKVAKQLLKRYLPAFKELAKK